MDQELLVKDQYFAGATLLSLMGDKYPIAVAFWLRDAENESWYLYIASEQFLYEKRPGYSHLHEIFRVNSTLGRDLDPFRVRLISHQDFRAERALKIVSSTLNNTGHHYLAPAIWGMGGTNAWFYPPVDMLQVQMASFGT